MTSPDPRNWTFRPAAVSEAEEACAVIRRSIIELCGADHDSNPAILDRWLANETPDQVRQWIEANPGGVLAGTGGAGLGGAEIGGVGMVMPDGRIALNYVAPWARFSGVSKGLIGAMERGASGWGPLLPSDQHRHGARVLSRIWLSGRRRTGAFVWRQARVPDVPSHSLDGPERAGPCRTAGRRAQVRRGMWTAGTGAWPVTALAGWMRLPQSRSGPETGRRHGEERLQARSCRRRS
jgi:hypothetical protein